MDQQGAIIPRLSLTPNEAAASTGFNRARIYKAISDNKLIVRRDGKATVIELTELQRWLSTLPGRESMAS